MSELDFLRSLAGALGLGGLVVGTFFLLFRDMIRRRVFSRMSERETSRFFRLTAILIFAFAVLGLLIYASGFPRPESEVARSERLPNIPLAKATLRLDTWPLGGWLATITNPTNRKVDIGRAKLVAEKQATEQYDSAFMIACCGRPNGHAGNPRELEPNSITKIHMTLFACDQIGRTNWKTLRNLRFSKDSTFNNKTCKVCVELLAIDGEKIETCDPFACSRIPVPPVNC